MAAPRNAGYRRRSPNFVRRGEEGSRTGLVLEPRPRDENGMELTDGLFSPTPVKNNARRLRQSNGTLTSSEDMELVESSAPEAGDYVSAVRPQRQGSLLPIPTTRSPTTRANISATPVRRPVYAANSQAKSTRRMADKSSPLKHAVNVEDASNVGRPAFSSPMSARDIAISASKLVGRRSVYDFPRSSHEPDREVTPSPLMDQNQLKLSNNAETIADGTDTEMDEEAPHLNGDRVDDVVVDVFPADAEPEPETVDLPTSDETPLDPLLEQESGLEQDAVHDTIELPTANSTSSSPANKRKAAQLDEDGPEPEDESHSSGVGSHPPVSHSPEAQTSRRGKAKGATKKRGKALSKKSTNKKVAKSPEDGDYVKAPPKPAQRQRHQTPSEGDGVAQTRFGRNIYKPLQYWKGERAIFEEQVRLPALKEIIRIDECTPVKRKRANNSANKKRRGHDAFEEDIDDAEPEPWEEEGSPVTAPVHVWDHDSGVGLPDEETEQRMCFSNAQLIAELAFAAKHLKPRPLPDNPNFLFTKTLTLPFFGSGVVEIPPNGFKDLKNARKFQFIFFVHSGKVAVEVAGTRFVVSRGGMWQVPRGNFYSISNESDSVEAIIFYAQGCEVPAPAREPPSLEMLQE